MLGGYHGKPHEYHAEGQSRDLWRLSLSAGTWERVSQLDAGVQGAALVAHNQEVCRFGGTRIHNQKGEPTAMQSIAEAACFDTTTRTWRALPPLPAGRSSHEATLIGSTVYIAGGWRMGDEQGGGTPKTATWHKDLLALDLSAPTTWSTHPADFERRALDVVASDGKVVVIGGLTPNRKVTSAVSVFDPATKSWSAGPDFPGHAFGVAATNMGGAAYASARDGAVFRFADNTWTRIGELTFPRFFHRLAPGPSGKLVAIGGITGMQSIGRTRHTELFTVSPTEPRIQQWVMDNPGLAKNRQGILFAWDSLYFFGGNNSLGQHDFAPDNFESAGWRVHLPSMRAEKVAPYPHKRQTMQTLSTEKVGFAIGGFGHPEPATKDTKAVSHTDVFVFDFDKEAWSPRKGLPRGRTQFGLAAHKDKLWIFGGLNYDPVNRKGMAAFEHVTSILTAPLAGDAAFEKAKVKMPGPRRAFGGAVLGDNYYITGGMKEGFQLVEGCLRFDFSDQKFHELPCPAKNRLSAELVPLNGRLYVVGGSVRGANKKMKPERSIETYDPATNKWRTVIADVGFDTKHSRAFAYRDRILIVTTHMTDPHLRVVLIDPTT